uniref:Thymocyte selection associated high mobility group box n=1 Tax=Nothoprocta perdicaria TaxID=30464 RepID=A0A8C6YI07_NOTPE
MCAGTVTSVFSNSLQTCNTGCCRAGFVSSFVFCDCFYCCSFFILESEDFNIPPITPPSLPDHSLVHLNEIESGYHSLCHPMNHNGLLPFHPQNMDLPEITVSNMLGQDGTLLSNSLSVMQDLRNTEGAQYSSHPQMATMRPRVQPADIRQPGMMQHGQLTTINQSQLSAQLGLNMGGNNVPHNSPSPPGSKSATPSPSSSVHEDEGEDSSKVGLDARITM